jgi:hypothetical protein
MVMLVYQSVTRVILHDLRICVMKLPHLPSFDICSKTILDLGVLV